jgi:hypothetical protein
MWPGWPPLPIVFICALTVVSAVGTFAANLQSMQEALALYPPGWEPVAYAIAVAMMAFFVFTLVGLWRMRRWALIARIAVHIITPIQMTLAWEQSWEIYPMLGPFVSWFWFVVLLICTLPYWERMTWRFP